MDFKPDDVRVRVAREIYERAGVAEPARAVLLSLSCMRAEKNDEEVTRDPVTGCYFTGLALMDQLEAEGLPRMGEEFSRRRGYTVEEIATFLEMVKILESAIRAGASVDELSSADAVLAGVFDCEIGIAP